MHIFKKSTSHLFFGVIILILTSLNLHLLTGSNYTLSSWFIPKLFTWTHLVRSDGQSEISLELLGADFGCSTQKTAQHCETTHFSLIWRRQIRTSFDILKKRAPNQYGVVPMMSIYKHPPGSFSLWIYPEDKFLNNVFLVLSLFLASGPCNLFA